MGEPGILVWEEEFPSSYRVPRELGSLVLSKVVEDMSWRQDPCPSFGTKLRDKNWVRLWVEHPNANLRHGWSDRFTVVVQPDPLVPFGWRMWGGEEFPTALTCLTDIIRLGGPRWKFKILDADPSGGAA